MQVQATEPYEIRLATVADTPVLAEFRCRMFLDMGALAPADYPQLYAYCLPAIESATASGELTSWLALDSGQPVASTAIRQRGCLPRLVPAALGGGVQPAGQEGLVVNVYVVPAYRGRGIAKLLMLTAQQWAYQRGIRNLVLHASDMGRPLYEHLGWVPNNEMRFTWPGTGLPPLPPQDDLP